MRISDWSSDVCSSDLFSCEETTMGVQIEAMDGGRLKVTGDVESLLNLPGRAVTDGFSFAFSDGTLIRGHHDIATGRCHLALAVEGAAMVRIMRQEIGRAHV